MGTYTSIDFVVRIDISCEVCACALSPLCFAVTLGLYSFSVDDPNNIFDTNGECKNYSDYPNGEDVEWTVRAAQVCAIIAPVCGLALLLIVVSTRFFCPLPCSEVLVKISTAGVNVGASLVWLIVRNDVCVSMLINWALRFGCRRNLFV
jgi:hypothetical protein